VDSRYIKYKYANLCIFQVDSRWTPENHLESSGVHLNSVGQCKVLPFENLANFKYTETAVKGLLSKELVNMQLARINSTWAVRSLLSIENHRDMEKVLVKACKYFVQVHNCNFCCTVLPFELK
jgi:muconolactone delta-isomerase